MGREWDSDLPFQVEDEAAYIFFFPAIPLRSAGWCACFLLYAHNNPVRKVRQKEINQLDQHPLSFMAALVPAPTF